MTVIKNVLPLTLSPTTSLAHQKVVVGLPLITRLVELTSFKIGI